VIALSSDRAEAMTLSLEVKDLGYDLYSDSTLAAARALGIACQMSPEEVEEYREYGIDLEKTTGETHHGLPVPSVFLVKAGGQILWVSSNPDYEVRPENEELLNAARKASGTTSK